MSKKQLTSETFTWTPNRKYKKIYFAGVGTVLVMSNPEKRKERIKIISKAVKKIPREVKVRSSYNWYNSPIGLRYREAVKKIGLCKSTESISENRRASMKKALYLRTKNNPFKFVDGIIEEDVLTDRLHTCSGVVEDRSILNG